MRVRKQSSELCQRRWFRRIVRIASCGPTAFLQNSWTSNHGTYGLSGGKRERHRTATALLLSLLPRTRLSSTRLGLGLYAVRSVEFARVECDVLGFRWQLWRPLAPRHYEFVASHAQQRGINSARATPGSPALLARAFVLQHKSNSR